jgi:putative ABC transport system ATP-binding protein
VQAEPSPDGARARSAGGVGVAVEGVGRVFPGPVVALADVSFTLERGEFVALTGPSGSGKSTLLAIIGGLDHPSQGRVVVDGSRLPSDGIPASYHRDVVGFVFQEHHLLTHLTARANVELPMIGAGVGSSERRRRALELLDEVGLAHRVEALPSRMSGGERQRVAVARALANEPRLLLADEPTGSLDRAAGERVLALLEHARARRSMTMLVVSYDQLIASRADRMLTMADGRLVEDGPPGQRPSSSLPERAVPRQAG